MGKPKLNDDALREAVAWVRHQAMIPEPDREWYQEAYALSGSVVGRECGTCFCVAGHVVAVTDGPNRALDLDDGCHKRAEEILGLTADESWALFEGDNSVADVERIACNIAAAAGVTL